MLRSRSPRDGRHRPVGEATRGPASGAPERDRGPTRRIVDAEVPDARPDVEADGISGCGAPLPEGGLDRRLRCGGGSSVDRRPSVTCTRSRATSPMPLVNTRQVIADAAHTAPISRSSRRAERMFSALLRSTEMPDLRVTSAYRPTGDQPQGDRPARRVAAGREPRPDAARRDRDGQDGDDGLGDGGAPAARARDRAQQDARRAALQRVPRVLPGERGRVLRLLLRLLPARGVRPAGRPLHREGLVAERRHRAPAARRDELAAHAPRRRRRRLRLLHLRARLAGGVAREGADPRGRRRARPRRDAPHADRLAVRPQRHGARARALPGARRRRRGAAGERRDGVPDLDVRRRGRADLPLRPAHRRGAVEARQPRHLAGDGVHHLEADGRARGRRDPPRARGAGGDVRGGGADARGAPHPPAHRVRPRDAEGARLLQRDRELLARPRGPPARVASVHADRLLPGRLRRLHRRVPPDRPADRRDVRGRPLAQADARRLRLPAPVGARQPAAPLRRVPRQGGADGVRLRDARVVRAAALAGRSPSS